MLNGMNVVAFLFCLLLGIVLGYLIGKSKYQKLLVLKESEQAERENEKNRMVGELESIKKVSEVEKKSLCTEVDRLKTSLQELNKEKNENINKLELQYQKQLEDLRTRQNDNFDKYKSEVQSQASERMSALKAEFQTLAQQVLDAKSTKLTSVNDEHLDLILKPLKDRLESLDRAVKETNEKGAANRSSFEESIKNLIGQTQHIGQEAEKLTKALRGSTKTQGDWGEMVLESILEKSGLRRGEEYFIQEDCLTEEGRHVRPDVIVRFPDKRSIIIDSKVSITAYTNYINEEDDEKRQKYLLEHLTSVRKHLEELSAKDYPTVVKSSDDYVLMFMPNEASYIAAVQTDPELNSIAYQKHVIVVCPTILIMTLQIVYNIWQSDRQNRNVEEIIDKGNALYNKFVAFGDNFLKVGICLGKTKEVYDQSYSQLATGRGNIVKRLEDMRELGLSPKKGIPDHLLSDSEKE
ncbi:MAG: DNA recombination protein RmuC [Bacteroidaceae bacterium]